VSDHIFRYSFLTTPKAAAQLAVNDISPMQSSLGTINGLALSLSSGVRAFTPALFLSIFAIGVRKQILDGQLIWLIMIIMTLIYGTAIQWLPEKAHGRQKVKPNNGDQADEN
jgi:hypothetical protein